MGVYYFLLTVLRTLIDDASGAAQTQLTPVLQYAIIIVNDIDKEQEAADTAEINPSIIHDHLLIASNRSAAMR